MNLQKVIAQIEILILTTYKLSVEFLTLQLPMKLYFFQRQLHQKSKAEHKASSLLGQQLQIIIVNDNIAFIEMIDDRW